MVSYVRRLSSFSIQGYAEKGFEAVRIQFERNFAKDMEENAQLCIYYRGKKVVDLWGGSDGKTDAETSTACIFSSGKVLESLCIATLVDRNLLKYSDKVIQHWPEYGFNDKRKESITLADVLRHEGGMPMLTQTLSINDVQTENIKKNAVGKILERQGLRYPPVKASTIREYHALTRGLVLNEIFRRVDPFGRTIGECLRDEISGPLGVDTAIGLTDEQISKSANVSVRSLPSLLLHSMMPRHHSKVEPNLRDLIGLTLCFLPYGKFALPLETFTQVYNIQGLLNKFMDVRVKAGELPSANAESSARGIARIAAMVANGGEIDGLRILSGETIDALHGEPVDALLHPISDVTSFTQGGVNIFKPVLEPGPVSRHNTKCRDGWVGWFGLGGSVFQWHPQYNIGFGYVPTFLAYEDIANTRGACLQEKAVGCVKELLKG